MSAYTVFMDESGNTGSNYLDFDQPIFVFGGVSIDHKNMSIVEKKFYEIKAKYNIPKGRELHAKSLFKKNKTRIIEDLINLLLENKSFIFFSITEKKFIISNFIDSEFFDPEFNDSTDNSWTQQSPEMNNRSNFFYNNLSDETLIYCGNAFRYGDGMREAYEFVRKDIKGKKYEIDLYEIIGGVEQHIDQLAALTSAFNKSNTDLEIPTGAINTPNFIAFSGLIQKIDDFFANINADDISLIFDSSREFNVIFKFVIERLKTSGKHVIIYPTGRKQTIGFDHIKNFTCMESEDSIFIQLSDLFTSSIKNVFQKIYFDDGSETYSKFESFILYFVVSTWQEFHPMFSEILISNSFMTKVIKTFCDANKHNIFNT
jgi:uncharacterized protein DUF3800